MSRIQKIQKMKVGTKIVWVVLMHFSEYRVIIVDSNRMITKIKKNLKKTLRTRERESKLKKKNLRPLKHQVSKMS